MSSDLDDELEGSISSGLDASDDTEDDSDSGSILEGDSGSVAPPVVESRGLGFAARLVGLLAVVLGLIGCVLALAGLAASIRFGFTASDTARTTVEPLEAAVDRLETRIDQADDLIDRDGMSGDQLRTLEARVDGLSDTADAATQAFAIIDNHVVYAWLPVDKERLSSALARFEVGSEEAVGFVRDADELTPAQAAAVGDRINTMQTAVSSTGDRVDETLDSLVRWIRLAAFGGVVLSLLTLWAYLSLIRLGWRGLRGVG